MTNTPKPPISQILAIKTFAQLGLDKDGNPLPKNKPLNSPKTPYPSPNSSFKIKDLEKTRRQSLKGKAYRYSALYRNAVVLRLLVKKFTADLNPSKHHRYISQINSAARSVVANIHEDYTRPSTKEYLDFLGYSKGSLEEVRGDIIDAKDDGILPFKPGSSLQSIGIKLKPTPPPKSLLNSPKTSFDPLREYKRIIRGVKRDQLTFQVFLELTNKTNYLLDRTVQGLHRKLSTDYYHQLHAHLSNHWSKY